MFKVTIALFPVGNSIDYERMFNDYPAAIEFLKDVSARGVTLKTVDGYTYYAARSIIGGRIIEVKNDAKEDTPAPQEPAPSAHPSRKHAGKGKQDAGNRRTRKNN